MANFLVILPEELVASIIDNITDRGTLAYLALSCKAIHPVAQRCLYADCRDIPHNKARPFFRSISGNAELAKLVKRYHYVASTLTYMSFKLDMSEDPLPLFLKAVSAMVNLEELIVDGKDLTSGDMAQILTKCNFEHLTTLKWYYEPSASEMVAFLARHSTIQELHIAWADSIPPFPPECLPSLRTLSTDGERAIKEFLPGRQVVGLTSLNRLFIPKRSSNLSIDKQLSRAFQTLKYLDFTQRFFPYFGDVVLHLESLEILKVDHTSTFLDVSIISGLASLRILVTDKVPTIGSDDSATKEDHYSPFFPAISTLECVYFSRYDKSVSSSSQQYTIWKRDAGRCQNNITRHALEELLDLEYQKLTHNAISQ